MSQITPLMIPSFMHSSVSAPQSYTAVSVKQIITRRASKQLCSFWWMIQTPEIHQRDNKLSTMQGLQVSKAPSVTLLGQKSFKTTSTISNELSILISSLILGDCVKYLLNFLCDLFSETEEQKCKISLYKIRALCDLRSTSIQIIPLSNLTTG